MIIHANTENKRWIKEMQDGVSGLSDVTFWKGAPEHVMAFVSGLREVSCLGAGHFPLMGATVARMEKFLAKAEFRSVFHLRWTAMEIEAALLPRLKIADALCRSGALLGAPQSKIGEMARHRETPMTRKILARDYVYTDRVEDFGDARPAVGLATPIVLPQKLLFQVSGDFLKESSTVDKRYFCYENDREVETLFAWLPDLREALLKAIDLRKITRFHRELLKCQNSERIQLEGQPFPECWDLINPEGSLGVEAFPPHEGASGTFLDSLKLGLVLTAYDPDMLIGRLLGKQAKDACRIHQQKWHRLILEALEARPNRKRIMRLAALGNAPEVEDAYRSYISHVQKTGSRLVRFVIEQAAVNFSKGLLSCAHELGVGPQNWPSMEPAERALPVLQDHIKPYWPAVGIRVDYLLRLAGSEVRKKAIPQLKKSSRRRRAETEFSDALSGFDVDDEEDDAQRVFTERLSPWRHGDDD